MKAVAIVGNLAEIIIATTMAADLFSKIRGNKTTSSNLGGDDNPQPEQPLAA